MSARLSLAICVSLVPAPLAAEPRSIEGNWLGFPVTGVMLGVIVPVIEELEVVGSEGRQRLWSSAAFGCSGTADDPPVCAPPVSLGVVRLEQSGDRLSVQPEGVIELPFDLPEAEIWPLFQLADYDWLVRGDEGRLILSRDLRREPISIFDPAPEPEMPPILADIVDYLVEAAPTLERIYLRAPAGMAGWVFDYLVAAQLRVGGVICALDALHRSPADWDAFADHVAVLHPVTAELRRLQTLAGPDAAAAARLDALRTGPPDATEIADLPATAREAWFDHAALRHGEVTPPPGQTQLSALGILASEAVADRAQACEDHFKAF